MYTYIYMYDTHRHKKGEGGKQMGVCARERERVCARERERGHILMRSLARAHARTLSQTAVTWRF